MEILLIFKSYFSFHSLCSWSSPKCAKQFSGFFIRATKSSKSTYQCEIFNIFPCLYKFSVRTFFSSFAFNFFSRAAGLTPRLSLHLSFGSSGSNISAVLRLAKAGGFVELCLLLCCQFFVLFMVFLLVFQCTVCKQYLFYSKASQCLFSPWLWLLIIQSYLILSSSHSYLLGESAAVGFRARKHHGLNPAFMTRMISRLTEYL